MNNSLNRRNFMKQAGALSIAASAPALLSQAQEKSDERPNLIVILTDDQRWDTLGCMGNRIIQTPNLDKLAERGVTFDNHFCTTSICMSSRASILTGQYSRTHDINLFSQPLNDEQIRNSYPGQLRKAGYYTGFIGKWGLGGPLPKGDFDYFNGFSGQGFYFPDKEDPSRHLNAIMEEQAVEFLTNAPTDQPFCLSISTKAPHVQDGDPEPFKHEPRYDSLYEDVEIPRSKTVSEEHFERQPDFVQNSECRTRWQQRFATPEMYQRSVKNYYRLITGIDRMVGTILETLKEKGLDQNTVILFTSDNGFFLGEHGLAGKWLMYEESIRIPMIVYDPRLPEEQRGRRISKMTLNIDVAPTLLDYAKLDRSLLTEGHSVIPLINNESSKWGFGPVDWRTEWFYEHPFNHSGKIPYSEGIRNERWKYIIYPNHDYEQLFDLQNDPNEERNLAQLPEHREMLEQLRNRRKVWLKQLDTVELSSYGWRDPEGSFK